MDIVDGQIHLGPGGIDATLAAMDALGIQSVLIDEYWKVSARPGDPYVAADSIMRSLQPTAELAAMLHPDRFSYLVRPDPRDPELPAIIRMTRDAPHARALRITPGLSEQGVADFLEGGYDDFCARACECGLPVFMFVPGFAPKAADYAKKFTSLKIIIDHCGLMSNSMRKSLARGEPLTPAAQLAAFDDVLSLADLPNIALKWGHAPGMFEQPGFPGDGLRPILRKAISRFGAERILWASDFSMNQSGESWGELLFSVKGSPDLSAAEQAAILGGTARAWLDWPPPG